MKEYFGHKEIAARLKLHPTTVSRIIDQGLLLAYRRRRPNPTPGRTARCWYTNDELILLSEIKRCRKDLKVRLQKQAARREKKAQKRLLEQNTIKQAGQNGSATGNNLISQESVFRK